MLRPAAPSVVTTGMAAIPRMADPAVGAKYTLRDARLARASPVPLRPGAMSGRDGSPWPFRGVSPRNIAYGRERVPNGVWPHGKARGYAAGHRCAMSVSEMARKKTRPPVPTSPQARYEFAVACLNTMLEDAGPEELAAALGRMARASGGPKLAEKVELSADSLYRTLCRRGNPELRSATALLKAMGMRLVLQRIPAEATRHGTCVGYSAGRDERDDHG